MVAKQISTIVALIRMWCSQYVDLIVGSLADRTSESLAVRSCLECRAAVATTAVVKFGEGSAPSRWRLYKSLYHCASSRKGFPVSFCVRNRPNPDLLTCTLSRSYRELRRTSVRRLH